MLLTLHELQYFVAAFALFSGVIMFMRKIGVVKACGKVWRKTGGRSSAQLERILKELRPNGGESIKDSLVRIEVRQKDQMSLVESLIYADTQAIFRTDETGKVTSNNRAHHRLTGFSLDELKGWGCLNLYLPEERNRARALWLQAVEDEVDYSGKATFVHPKGYTYKVRVDLYKQLDEDGNLRGYLGTVTPQQDK